MVGAVRIREEDSAVAMRSIAAGVAVEVAVPKIGVADAVEVVGRNTADERAARWDYIDCVLPGCTGWIVRIDVGGTAGNFHGEEEVAAAVAGIHLMNPRKTVGATCTVAVQGRCSWGHILALLVEKWPGYKASGRLSLGLKGNLELKKEGLVYSSSFPYFGTRESLMDPWTCGP